MTAGGGRSRIHILLETAAIIGALAFSGVLAGRIYEHAGGASAWGVVASGVAFGYLVADLISGVVHWLADRFGTVRTPFFGSAFVLPFREHHARPEEITQDGFIETNGNNCIVTLLVLVLAFLFLQAPTGQLLRLFFLSLALFASLFGFATNQFHKWAHMPRPPAAARILQRAGLILTPEHHNLHHTSPFASHYCITTGWCNLPLDRLKIFWAIEHLVRRSSPHPQLELAPPAE